MVVGGVRARVGGRGCGGGGAGVSVHRDRVESLGGGMARLFPDGVSAGERHRAGQHDGWDCRLDGLGGMVGWRRGVVCYLL